jgi:hypothetical protein
MHQEACGRGFAAARLADDAECLARGDLERYVVDRLHHRLRAVQQPAAQRKMLGQAVDG